MSFFEGFFDYTPVNVDAMDFLDTDQGDSDSSADRVWLPVETGVFPSQNSEVFEIALGKKKNSSFTIYNKRFFLTPSEIYYANDGAPNSPCEFSELRGRLELSWSRVCFEAVAMEPIRDQGYLFKMTVARNKRFTDLYIPNEATMIALKQYVRRRSISTGFYDDFQVLKKLGSGAFASVRSIEKRLFFATLLF
jgi:hypothetical protein